MLRSKTRWKLAETDETNIDRLQSELGISRLAASLLVNRGISGEEEARRFLYKENLAYHDPFLMSGMKEAVERIQQAIASDERILIFGDYDADGVSSTTVLVYTLRELGATFDYYIPNRFTEGYGPNEAAFRQAKEDGYHLIVTVDTGISGVHEAEVAKEIGVDLIITDHHEPPPVLPDAYATINPKKPGCTYPFKGLAGVGVAFKLSQALLGRIPGHLLEIAAMGTIADLVPLQDENRLLASEGIRALQNSNKPGIKALLDVCGLKDQELNEEHLGFGIGPRLNAAGRLDSADPAVELLTTDDPLLAEQLASDIDALNKNRQELVNTMTKEAIEEVETNYISDESNRVLIIAKEGWNAGVIGIVASRLVEKYYRPTIVMSIDREKGVAKGSARSIEAFDMFANLSECRDILPHFGGHPMAAGMTIDLDYLEQLRTRLNNLAIEKLTEEDLTPLTKVDLHCRVEDVTLETIEEMNLLAPFGVSNPKPVVMLKDVHLSQIRRIGSQDNHLKVALEENGTTLDGVGFHFGYAFEEIASRAAVSVIGQLSVNEWNGLRKPQIFVKDIAVNEWQLFDYRGIRDLKKRLETLPLDKLVMVAFQSNTISKLGLEKWKDYVITDPSDKDVSFDQKYVMLLDLPDLEEDLVNLFRSGGIPDRTYVVFEHEEDHFFSTLPSREDFKWYYAFLMKKGSFHLRDAEKLAKHKGWSKETVPFMSEVFFELDFVTMDNGLISLNPQSVKTELTSSKTYRSKLEKAKLENDFCYSSYHALKSWFDQSVNCFNSTEEAIK
ncbi:single-stranded-DNA-specific exonuclease RecJ [Pseudalkalibacillus hwajinpoensis]|uniref:single-stranded-DNA-specific exonuclease RecJ n=1 Tax=Guptibacillus hwajinpoensis TaxID=208199 RepID=UPI001CD22943|nr:single-stranded-DNA-specific exonuclease RecJ [Pseudalkalibacillus hwajinpoensis]MCA0992802.1 single-stranded-DNA-specific exonuclease RecJ [Pseudalkalibacillus hwajinpoensis]